ncbi:MAG: lysophospholipid acyltransferase family protein [Planctomycetota bacterium]
MRSIVSAVWTVLLTIFCGIASTLVWPFSPSGRASGAVVRFWSRAMLWGMGVKLDVDDRHGDADGASIVVPNHSSLLDIPALSAGMPIPVLFVSRPFFFKIPFMGWGMYAAGHVSLDPKRPRQAARVLDGLKPRFDRGQSLVLFAEGTRSPDGRLQEYKRGPMQTAIKNSVPVIPVYVRGSADLLPKKSLWPRPGRIALTVGEPIPTDGLSLPDSKSLCRQVEAWAREQQRLADGSGGDG